MSHPDLDLILPHLAGVVVDRVQARPGGVEFHVRPRADGASCPKCSHSSTHVHSRYGRQLADAAVCTRRLTLRLQIRRFFCTNPDCPATTFTEQIENLTTRYARRSPAATHALTTIGLALAGRAGARMATQLGLRGSRSTILRVVRRIPDPPASTVVVLGIDDFALRRGHRYGTLMLDMATHRPIDLLPDREAATVATWLREHPGVQIVCRDRAGAYADGVRTGAPEAIQVADRWHLWHNLSEYVDKAVARLYRHLTEPPAAAAPPPMVMSPPAVPRGREGRLSERTRQRYDQVQNLHAQGKAIKAIMRELGLARETVRRFVRATSVEDLLAKTMIGSRSGVVDTHSEYLRQRWTEGCTTIAELYQEICQRGYSGSYATLRDWLRPWLDSTPQPPPKPQPPKIRKIVSWILRRPETLETDEHAALAELRARCPQLDRLTTHVQAFAQMLTHRKGHQVDEWITVVRADDLPELHSFATGLDQDHEAVVNGLTLPHSSGAVEGTVNRIKMIKRQMYGRANLDLLRKRVLLT